MRWPGTPAEQALQEFHCSAHVTSKGLRPGFRHCMVLFPHPAADSDGAKDVAATFERNASREYHDPSIIGGVDSEELIARLREVGKFFGRDIERPRGPGLLDGDIDASNPGLVPRRRRLYSSVVRFPLPCVPPLL